MLNQKKITVVLPAYNAAKTLRQTYDEIPLDVVDDVILTDDASRDDTAELARVLSAWSPFAMRRIAAMVAIRRPVTQPHSHAEPTSSSCCTPTTSTRPNC